MARGTGMAQVLADGIMGYLKGNQMQSDIDTQAEEQQAKRDDRAYIQQQRQDATDLQRQSKAAAMPATVDQGAGGVTLPATADNRDVGQTDGPTIANGGLQAGYRVAGSMYPTQAGADAAATAYNSPDAIVARQASVLRAAGKPLEAQQLETAQLQGQTAKLSLEKEHQDFLDKKFDKMLSGVSTPEDLAGTLSGSSLVGGAQVSAQKSADGKTFQLVKFNSDGSTTPISQPIGADATSIQKAAAARSQTMSYEQKVTMLQHQETLDETKRHNQSTEGQAGAQLSETSRHNRADEGIAAGGLSLQKAKFDADLKSDPTRVLPAGTKMYVSGLDKTIDRLDTAISKAMADGTWDPKSTGASDLLAQRNQAQRQRERLLAPYLVDPNGNAQGGKVPYDKLMGNQPAAPGAAPAPAGRVMTAAAATVPTQAAPSAVSAAPAAAPSGFVEDPAKTAMVNDELSRAAAERRAPSLPPDLQDYAEKMAQARSAEIQASTSAAAQARSQEMARQAAEQQAIRDRHQQARR